MENRSMVQTKPMMTFPNAVKTCLRKYCDFSGRATRAEYWWWVLAVVIGSSIFTAVDSSIASFSGQGYTPFATIFSLAIILPGLAVTARRLHDIGKRGWWQLAWVAISLLALIPIVVAWSSPYPLMDLHSICRPVMKVPFCPYCWALQLPC